MTPAGRVPLRPALGTWEETFGQMQQRVSRIIQDISIRARPQAETESSPAIRATSDRLAVAHKRLEDSRAAHRAELNLLMDRLKSRSEPHSSRGGLSERAPNSIPELHEELRRLDQRLELLKVRMTATVDAMTNAVDEVLDLRRVIQGFRQEMSQCHQTEAELAANQRQMAESLNLLHDLVARSTEISRSNAAWMEVLAKGPENRYQSLHDQLTRATARVDTRSTMMLVAAGLGLLSGLAALVVALSR